MSEAVDGGPGGSLPRALALLEKEVVACRACPRLVEWRERVAREKRAAYRDETYWGRPLPGFGDPDARALVVGLAPAAHGANRTGRMFTGDRSGEWLYRALYRAGLSNGPTSTAPGDGLELHGVWITAVVRCAPPGNRPTTEERDRCRPYLEREMDHFLPNLGVVVALGSFAFDQVLRTFRERDVLIPTPRPRFGHGQEVALDGAPRILASYHPSQQNTFTGRLTEEGFDEIWARVAELVSH